MEMECCVESSVSKRARGRKIEVNGRCEGVVIGEMRRSLWQEVKQTSSSSSSTSYAAE